MTTIFETVGIIGVTLILIAYGLLQIEKLSTKHLSYHALNLAGALLIIASLLSAWNLPALIMEIAWVLISMYGFLHCLYQTHKRKKDGQI